MKLNDLEIKNNDPEAQTSINKMHLCFGETLPFLILKRFRIASSTIIHRKHFEEIELPDVFFSFQGNQKKSLKPKEIGGATTFRVTGGEDSKEDFQELNSLLRRHGFGEVPAPSKTINRRGVEILGS